MKYKKIILISSIVLIVISLSGIAFLELQKRRAISYKDKIVVYGFKENQKIKSPLIIKGKARGSWFFEGDFPIILTDWDGLIIAQSYAMAKTNWMTTDYVEFEARIKFTKPDLYDRGSLILQKDNPSGLPEHDDALEIPIKFK